MRRLLAVLILVLGFGGLVRATPAIPPMPQLPSEPPGDSWTLSGCSEVTRLAFDTEESEATQWWGLSFWVLPDKPSPFLVALYANLLGSEDDVQVAIWIDLDRDGLAEEYYASWDEFVAQYPDPNVCRDILPRVK